MSAASWRRPIWRGCGRKRHLLRPAAARRLRVPRRPRACRRAARQRHARRRAALRFCAPRCSTAHARERSAVGVPPLAWDEGLAAHARAYAQDDGAHRDASTMPSSRRGRHARARICGPARAAPISYAEMIGHWVGREARLRQWRDFPTFSRTGQLAGRRRTTPRSSGATSTRVGCALASNATDDYLVCRYAPPGNVVGQRAF